MGVTLIDEYLKELGEDGKKYVSDFANFMQREYPQIKPKISFSMPMWLLGTKMKEGYIGISVAKNHFSIHFSDEDYVLKIAKELPNCKTGKRCINIKYGDNENYSIIEKKVKEHLNSLI